VTEDELLRLAAAAEARSSHPLAQTVLDELDRRALANDLSVDDFENVAGSGIRAHVGGREVLVGAQRLLERYNVGLGDLEPEVDRLLSEGKTLVLVAIDGRASGVLAAADAIRPSAAQAIAELKALGIEPVMMTGDSRRTAEAVARQVGIGRVFAEVLPEDKANGVRQLQLRGAYAPALQVAQLSSAARDDLERSE
jgi:P-type E1-E2 ATPase